MRAVFAVFAYVMVNPLGAQDFFAPLTQQLEAMQRRIESATEAERPLDVLAALDYYRVTSFPESAIPSSALLAEAKAAATTDDPRRALKALNAYLKKAPADDPARAFETEYTVKADAAEAATAAKIREDDLRREKVVQEHKPPAVVVQLIDDMVRIPGGIFLMGSQSRIRADTDEKPVHAVRIKPFRLAKYEVTFEQYDLFARMTGRPLPQDGGYGRDRHPVGNVSWEDAKEFTYWLQRITGLNFRLSSEAEWEYVARAGTKTDFPWRDVRFRLCERPRDRRSRRMDRTGAGRPVSGKPLRRARHDWQCLGMGAGLLPGRLRGRSVRRVRRRSRRLHQSHLPRRLVLQLHQVHAYFLPRGRRFDQRQHHAGIPSRGRLSQRPAKIPAV